MLCLIHHHNRVYFETCSKVLNNICFPTYLSLNNLLLRYPTSEGIDHCLISTHILHLTSPLKELPHSIFMPSSIDGSRGFPPIELLFLQRPSPPPHTLHSLGVDGTNQPLRSQQIDKRRRRIANMNIYRGKRKFHYIAARAGVTRMLDVGRQVPTNNSGSKAWASIKIPLKQQECRGNPHTNRDIYTAAGGALGGVFQRQ